MLGNGSFKAIAEHGIAETGRAFDADQTDGLMRVAGEGAAAVAVQRERGIADAGQNQRQRIGAGLGAATHITGAFAFAAVGKILEVLLKESTTVAK